MPRPASLARSRTRLLPAPPPPPPFSRFASPPSPPTIRALLGRGTTIPARVRAPPTSRSPSAPTMVVRSAASTRRGGRGGFASNSVWASAPPHVRLGASTSCARRSFHRSVVGRCRLRVGVRVGGTWEAERDPAPAMALVAFANWKLSSVCTSLTGRRVHPGGESRLVFGVEHLVRARLRGVEELAVLVSADGSLAPAGVGASRL